MKPETEPTRLDDASLDRALAQLPRVDLPPWAASSQLRAAQARLRGHRAVSRVARYEPEFLIACSAIHLLWVLWRAFA
jgi:hypothetical protein